VNANTLTMIKGGASKLALRGGSGNLNSRDRYMAHGLTQAGVAVPSGLSTSPRESTIRWCDPKPHQGIPNDDRKISVIHYA